jgi:signal transduction histidine kinase
MLRIVAQRGFPDDDRVKEIRMPIREGDVFRRVEAAAHPVLISDVLQEPGWQQVEWLPLDKSWMGVPLFSKDQVIGMISLTRREVSAFNQDEAVLASTFALQAAIALENAGLYEEITRFNEQLEQMVLQRTEELNQALHNLERLDKNKSDFIGVAAHELRTPLTVMRGYMGMMEADQNIKNSQYLSQSVNGVLKGIERLHEIVNSMLDVVRIESQILDLNLELTSVATIVKRVKADLEDVLAERQLAIEIGDLTSLPRIKADPPLLLKVFQNVIVNAIKYTPDGGRVTISGQKTIDEKLGECVEVQVRDTGIGIDPEYLELIFEKFYQTGEAALHSTGKTIFKGGGPGLGLSIARGVTQAHGGRIWAESKGHDEAACPGSCFHILLPVVNSTRPE